MLSEFSLIERFFARRHQTSRHALLGIGDDCALLAPPSGEVLAVSTDMLVEGRHFFANAEPHALGHKALAVNLSDLAAMGARPLAFTLALALPEARESWLAAFSAGLFELAERHGCELIGGDTTAGPLNLCLTVFGSVAPQQAMRRDAAQAGDDIWISGTLGDARAGLGVLRGEWSAAPADALLFRHALEQPEPRIALGLALRGLAHAALDLSDGLAGDLNHILLRSQLWAQVDVDAVPRSSALRRLPLEVQRQVTLAGGDDYELCFTAPVTARAKIEAASRQVNVPVTRIGTLNSTGNSANAASTIRAAKITPPASRITWTDAAGTPLNLTLQGFDHFHAD
ncbi:thiamine-phosphate kinase [Paraburkholderia bonniea]|uniref:thiamine-phosphate kinase n=1 Tax=Paraburkholderia bonniea TaxID=2152891 RepID=UPI001290E442|nr:thiamine-phosphate kinase [Paraburkholderia bonniea]WJF89879.1 thiamine-phosphate kinase [Paraburkholderia bonniea]WJF93193.1 thiamine-phosphate kinase [Paraburkholderia bonniea]